MSKSAINKLIKTKLLKDVERAERKSIGEAARAVLSTAAASQCLVLNRKAVNALIIGMEAGIGRKLTTYEKKKYRKGVKDHFIGMSQPFPQIAGRKYFLHILRKNKLELGKNIFFLGTDFDGVKDKYHEFNKNFVEETGPKSLRERSYERGDSTRGAAGAIQFDHGAEGTAVGTLGGGSSAVSVALDKGVDFERLKTVAKKNLTAILARQFKDLTSGERTVIKNRLFDIIVNQDQVVQTGRYGGIVGGVGMIITPVITKINKDRSSIERKEQDAIIEAVSKTIEETDWYNLEGSSSMRQKAEAATVQRVVEKLEKITKQNKGSSVKLDPSVKKTKLNTKSKGRGRSKEGKGVKIRAKTNLSGELAAPLVAAKGGGSRAKKSNFNALQMIGILNQRLPDTVAKNMGSPRLNYRTGRFASSVRITDIVFTAKGHPSIGYTYQRDPYEVYESSSGSKFSSLARDPRSLIDVSIRELAAQQAIGRLFTRRV